MHLLNDLAHTMDGARRAAHNASAKRAQVELIEKRMVQHRDIHRRHAIDGGALLFFNRVKYLHGVKAFHEDHSHALIYRAHNPKDATKAVEKRHRNAKTVLNGEVLGERNPKAVIGNIAVSQLHALREACRATRILHIHNIIDIHLRLAFKVVRVRNFLREVLNFIEGINAAMFRAAQEHDALQVRICRATETLTRHLPQFRHEFPHSARKVAVAVAFSNNQVFGIGLLKREVEFEGLIIRIKR